MLVEFGFSNMIMSPAHSIFLGLFVLFYAACVWMNEAATPAYYGPEDLPVTIHHHSKK